MIANWADQVKKHTFEISMAQILLARCSMTFSIQEVQLNDEHNTMFISCLVFSVVCLQ